MSGLANKRLPSNEQNLALSSVILTAAVVFLVTANLVIYSRDIAGSIEAYRIGDWLINYQSGLVRRGLIGELIFQFSRTGQVITWVAFAIQAATYLLISLFTLLLYLEKRRSKSWMLLLFSPAFIFLFPFYDPSGWFRKELLVYLALVLMLFGLRQGIIRFIYLWASLVIYFVAVFSHEIASLALAFFLYPLYEVAKKNSKDSKCIRIVMGVYGLISLVGLVVAMLYPGGIRASEGICNSLLMLGQDPELCSGAIQYLSVDMHHGIKEVANKIYTRHYLPIYCYLFFLAALPIFLTNWWKTRWLLLLLGGLSLTPIFLVGMDWGRWIAFLSSLVYFCMLFDSSIENVEMKQISWGAIISYAIFWSIPHIQGAPNRVIETYIGSGPGLGIIDIGFAKLPDEIKRSPLRHPVWMELQKRYKGVTYFPLNNNSKEQDIFYYFSKMNFISSNIKNRGELKNEYVQKENLLNQFAIQKGNFFKENFYILDNRSAILALRHLDPNKDLLLSVNGFYVYAPDAKERLRGSLLFDMAKQGELHSAVNLGAPLNFIKSNRATNLFLQDGWSFSEEWGTWSDGESASITLPIPKEGASEIQINFRVFLAREVDHQKINLYMNGILAKTLLIRDGKTTSIVLNLSKYLVNQALLTIRFEIDRPVSPFNLGISDDKRKLGIGIESIVLQ